ncbi:Hsp33 family molecular chaperone HslO [Kyrpidia tusciae]|uniref:Hsp33 family molecular chaperone HslO n=1 Tax=Kyrpidia tusciae TaxID=33943 RepID=UPI00069373F6|nr:Hsp33 family molecular chaperone HslO [Kyrpidia tusciae]
MGHRRENRDRHSGGKTLHDYIVRAVARSGKVRAYAARTTELVEELRRRHGTWPVVTAALGRAATVGAMMGAMLKGDQRLTVQVMGDGPVGTIVVDADAAGRVRGFADRPNVDLPLNDQGKLDVAGAVGKGALYVVKDLGFGEPYRGSVPLVSGELGEDFAYYFAVSEQLPSSVGVGVLVDTHGRVKQAGGFMIQSFPGLSEEETADLEGALTSIPSVTALLDRGVTPEELLAHVVPDVRVLDRVPVAFRCRCSRQRIERILVALGKEERESLCQEQGGAEVRCQFCGKVYRFSCEALRALDEGRSV